MSVVTNGAHVFAKQTRWLLLGKEGLIHKLYEDSINRNSQSIDVISP